jgi:hypothetical protein
MTENKSQEQKKSLDRHGETDTKISCWIDAESAENVKQVMEKHKCNKTTAIQIILKGNKQGKQTEEATGSHEESTIQCPYGALLKDDKVYCDNPEKKNLPKDRIILSKVCQKCLERCDERNEIIDQLKTLKTLVYVCPIAFVSQGDHDQQHEDIYGLPCIKNPDFDCRAFADQFSEEKKDDPEFYRQWNECPFQNKEKRKLFINRLENLNLHPKQDLLTEKGTLTSKDSEMPNPLLKTLEEISILQTDNEFLRTENNKLSESALLKENDSVRLQVIELEKKINEYYEPEIKKVQLVADKRFNILNEVISKTNTLFGNLKQNLPTYAKGYGDMLKQIEEFEGYLQIIIKTS